jgi:glyoxylase-like metal-dependent hydrolase (beta-lactamase superfamily II)
MIVLKEFNPHIWLTEVELDGFDVRGALILGDKRAVVWDTLSHPNDMKLFLPLIQNRDLIIVYSHADWDHIWGTAGLPYEDKLVIGHSTCLTRFETDVPETLHKKQIAEPTQWNKVKLIKPNLTFQSEISIDLGSLTLSLHSLAGHSPDCIVAFIPEHGVLLAGDTIEIPFPAIYEDSPLDVWIAELERWAYNPRLKTVIPAHGTIGGCEVAQSNVNYLQEVRDGGEIHIPDGLSNFYVETHKRNIQYGRRNP